MRILIYGLNYSPELIGVGKFTGEMAEWLAAKGHKVKVLTSQPYYPAWEIMDGYSQVKFTVETINQVSVIRCPLWVPTKPKTLARILHLLSFSISSFPMLLYQSIFRHQDIIMCIAPSFLCAPQTILCCLFAKKTKSWLHFQDFEICAMFSTKKTCLHYQLINKVAHKLQKCITRRFNIVSTISRTMCESIDRNYVSQTSAILFPNWVNTDFITPNADRSYYRKRWGIKDSTRVVLYSGNFGKKQGLDILISVARNLQHKEDLVFLMVGDGSNKKLLQELATAEHLPNVYFFPVQPLETLPELLRLADIHLVLQKKSVADKVLPSKLTSIFAAGGHAIISAEPDTELGNIVKENTGIARLVEPENVKALTLAIIEELQDIQSNNRDYNNQARKFALKYLAKNTILTEFEEELKKTIYSSN